MREMLQYQFDVFILFYTFSQTNEITAADWDWHRERASRRRKLILTTPGDYDDYDSGDDYYFYDDGYRFVQLSIQN